MRGEAATSILNAVAELQPHFDFAAEADRAAETALDSYARVLEDGQADAGRAIEVWEHGEHATRAAQREQVVAVFGESGALVFDPGQAQRANAERILRLAREDVTDAGNLAASALRESQSVHASSAGFWDVVGVALKATVGETVRGGLLSIEGGAAAFAGGVALDASGAGAPAGVAVNIAAAGVVAGGAVVAGASMSKVLQQAAGEDRVHPFTNEAAGPSKLAGYPGSEADQATDKALADSELKAIRSLESQIKVHRQKLDAYKANPDSFGNKDFLKNAPSQAVRDQIIRGRLQHLQGELDIFRKQIEQIRNKQ